MDNSNDKTIEHQKIEVDNNSNSDNKTKIGTHKTNKKNKIKKKVKTVWHFIWEDNSIWSWLVNIVLAFVLIKFIVYPALGFTLGTSFPIVAVISGSMEHNGVDFESWYAANHEFYEKHSITENVFNDFPYRNGFNTGDIMILRGYDPKNIEVGDVIVFRSLRPDPIIHRVVKKWKIKDETDINSIESESDDSVDYHFQTKGDNNRISIRDTTLNEYDINESQILGKAVFRIPLLGWIKIGFVKALNLSFNLILTL